MIGKLTGRIEYRAATDRKKSVVGQEDRDENAEVVTTAEENGRPVDDTEERAAAAADENADEKPKDEEEVVAEDANSDDDSEEVDEDAASDDDAEDEDKDGKKGKGKKAADAPMKKSTQNDDLAKSILSGVEKLIEKSVAPLKEEIEELKKRPAASKVKSTFAVKKGEDVADSQDPSDSAEGKLRAEFDSLNKRADELAADPNVGTHDERMNVAFKLRKLSRQLDPASVAKNEAVRATFNRGQ
jgi:hypothetical protein